MKKSKNPYKSKMNSRRKFLTTSGIATVGAMGALSCSSEIKNTEYQQTSETNPIVGHGDFKYKVDRN